MNRLSRLLVVLRQNAPLKFWASLGASMTFTLSAVWLIWIIAYGAWPSMQAARRLDILGKALWFNLFMVLVVVASLTLSRVSAKVFGGGFEIGHDDEDEDPKKVVTTTTTEVK